MMNNTPTTPAHKNYEAAVAKAESAFNNYPQAAKAGINPWQLLLNAVFTCPVCGQDRGGRPASEKHCG